MLHDDEVVAVKIQRPNIERTVEVDLEIMLHFASLMEKYIDGADIINPVAIVEEFEKTIKEELNFQTEARNIEKFSNNFQRDMTIYIPKVYKEYSTKLILTTEFINGLKLKEISSNQDLNPKLLAERGAQIVLKQIFEHGYFHADPHAGNLLFLPEDIICLLDFGMIGTLSPKYRDYLATLIVSSLRKDTNRMLYAIRKLTLNDTLDNRDLLEMELYSFLDKYASRSLDEINIGELLSQLINILISFKLKISPVLYMLLKALITTEDVAKKLDPEFKMISHLEPMAKKLIKEYYNPTRFAKDMIHSASDLAVLAKDFPNDAREIIELLKKGKLEITLEHKGLNSALSSYDKTSNKIITSIILAALIIASSLIIHSGTSPVWYGMSAIGLFGYILSTLLGLYLLWQITFNK